jgi:DNA-binding LytR/AlgR family response regulator
MTVRALIAEDEPLLAANLQAELSVLWPGLVVVANVGDGMAAVEKALALRPEVVFLDIRMPGLTGLEAAGAIADEWPAGAPLPLVVFVTAYDQYALQAFDRAAVDYVLKPVQTARLAQTCGRLQTALARRDADRAAAAAPAALAAALEQLRVLLATRGLGTVDGQPSAPAAKPPPAQRLAVIAAAVGNAVHLLPVDEVIYFEAADKYVRVITASREYLIRTALRELLPQLDPQRFWQIHRGTVVRADAIATAARDESGKIHLTLRGHADRLVASRLYAGLFKAM